jgi:hypothetical protein
MTGIKSCEAVWFAGLVAWYIIRRPFERRARRVATVKSFVGPREHALLVFAFAGLWVIPAIYAFNGFPRQLDRPLVPTIAYLGVGLLCGALALFYRIDS